MRKIYFLLGIHNHQPVGNFPEVFEEAYRLSYAPFLETMARHPGLKWSLHCTGPLWDYLLLRHPEYVETVGGMFRAGRLELLGGGYYEPVMPVIPDRDKQGQIRKLTGFLRETFGSETRGMWVAERVWEPSLARAFAEAGIRYTVLDDTHFAAAGLDTERLYGYYVTEEQGATLNVFPISRQLRYMMPFATVEQTIEYFARCASEGGNRALVMADDGEKFGHWPGTYRHVYQEGWLDRFLDALEQNAGWIETITFSEYMDRFPAEGRVYLPAASYFEMSEWSLPGDAQESFADIARQFEGRPEVKRFLRGGFWRNFLTKYDEANNLHKKMLEVSAGVEEAARDGSLAGDTLDATRNALYAGQCNCAYWHGVFGGLYLPHLRSALYRNLLAAEAALPGVRSPAWKRCDFDGDGREEIRYAGERQNLYFAPARGGALFEWDLLGPKVNLLNVLTRRGEAYHRKLRETLANDGGDGAVKHKERNLDSYLHYDWYRRASLLDHFLQPDTQFEDFRRCRGELGDFVLGEYTVTEETGDGISLSREGAVWEHGQPRRVAVSKRIEPLADGLRVAYRIESREDFGIDALFGPEFCFAFCYPVPDEFGARRDVTDWTRYDEGSALRLHMHFHAPVELWVFPLETVSLSEGGFERTYQGTVACPLYRLKLPPRGCEELQITVRADGKGL